MSDHGATWFRGAMIGKGNFGSVYMATSKKPKTRLGNSPAVMAVKSRKLSDSDTLEKEKQVLEDIRGTPYVIGCFGEEITVDESSGEMTYNLLLEYASGGTLADFMTKFGCHGLPESVVRGYAKSIVSGLLHIHECGYVHCNIKPENILLVSVSYDCCDEISYVAKIGDLVLAKKRERLQSKRRRVIDQLRGTPSYMPPESVVDKVQGPPADIWALGCVVFEMLTGKSIWSEKKPEDNIRVLMSDECWSPAIPDGISSEARSFLKGCLEREPVFRSTAEMLMDHPFVSDECEDFSSCEEVDDVPVERCL